MENHSNQGSKIHRFGEGVLLLLFIRKAASVFRHRFTSPRGKTFSLTGPLLMPEVCHRHSNTLAPPS